MAETVVGAEGTRTITAQEFGWLQAYLRERTGIELKPGKEPMVMGRLDRRLRHHGLASYGAYFQLLASGDEVENRLAVDLLTTNETYFFREPRHFEFLADRLRALPGLSGPGARPVRVWSAACSSGEEAYSIAMTLAAVLPPEQEWEVLATDISSRVLDVGRRGVYPVEAAERIPKGLVKAYCLRGREEYEGLLAIDADIRSRVRFTSLNLLELADDLGRFDVIFLRNVMIYFAMETKRTLVARLCRMLRPGGYLVISHSETLNGINPGLRLVQPAVYQLPQEAPGAVGGGSR